MQTFYLSYSNKWFVLLSEGELTQLTQERQNICFIKVGLRVKCQIMLCVKSF